MRLSNNVYLLIFKKKYKLLWLPIIYETTIFFAIIALYDLLYYDNYEDHFSKLQVISAIYQ